jgi:beta-lactamase class A
MKVKNKKQFLIFLSSVLFFSGGIFWYLAFQQKNICSPKYKWIDPVLDCRKEPAISKVSYTLFREKLIAEIEAMKKDGKIREAAVYFHDLENGPTMGVREREKFTPASLLKVPVMLTYFRIAEDDPKILDKVLTFGEIGEEMEQKVDRSKIVKPNTSYPIDDLIFRMIAYSDNRAYFGLRDYLNHLSPNVNLVGETLHELGLVDPGEDIELATLTVKNYSSIFRLLYHGSYLSPAFSEKALAYLSASEFDDGLKAGVPDEIGVANKYGERRIDNKKQLHDCGIIYFPDNPFTLCVMTRGDDFEHMLEAIKKISNSVWDEVESRKLNLQK